MYSLRRLLPALVAIVVVLCSTACSDSTGLTNRTLVRFVNAVSNTSSNDRINLSFNGVLMGGGMTYRNYTACMEASPGQYTASIAAGTNQLTAATLSNVAIDSAGKYIVIATGTLADPHLTVLRDSYIYPSRNRAKIRPFNAVYWASGMTPSGLDMYITPEVNGNDLGSVNSANFMFNESRDFVDTPALRVRVQFTWNGSHDILTFDGPVTLLSRDVRTVVVAGVAGGGGISAPRTFVVPACL